MRSHPVWEVTELAPGEPYRLLAGTPNPFAPNRVWMDFRDKMSEMLQHRPADLMPRALVEWVDRVLAWRQSIPEHLQFWDLE